MTMAEAADYLRYDGARAADKARQFLQRNDVRLHRRGRAYLVRQDAIDAFLETGMGELDREAQERVRRMRTGTR